MPPLFQERGFYIAAAGGASYHNLSHIRRTLQDKGFSDQRVHLHDLTDQMGLLSVQVLLNSTWFTTYPLQLCVCVCVLT